MDIHMYICMYALFVMFAWNTNSLQGNGTYIVVDQYRLDYSCGKLIKLKKYHLKIQFKNTINTLHNVHIHMYIHTCMYIK